MIWIPALRTPFSTYGWTTERSSEEVEKYGMDGAVFGGLRLVATVGATAIVSPKCGRNDQVIAPLPSLGTDFVHHGLDEDFGRQTAVPPGRGRYSMDDLCAGAGLVHRLLRGSHRRQKPLPDTVTAGVRPTVAIIRCLALPAW